MESNRKQRRGFMKGKLMPFYRAPKPSSTTTQYSSKVVKPSQSSPSTATVGYLVPQDYVISQPKPKVSFIIPDANVVRDKFSQYDHIFGVAGGDEAVDAKAASYIATVQERFKLERMNSERMKFQDVQETH